MREVSFRQRTVPVCLLGKGDCIYLNDNPRSDRETASMTAENSRQELDCVGSYRPCMETNFLLTANRSF